MATAVVLCSACGKKDASVNDATQAAQASSTEAENLYKEGSQYVGEEDYESAIIKNHFLILIPHFLPEYFVIEQNFIRFAVCFLSG